MQAAMHAGGDALLGRDVALELSSQFSEVRPSVAGVACPLQWLPVMLASTPSPPCTFDDIQVKKYVPNVGPVVLIGVAAAFCAVLAPRVMKVTDR